MVHLGGPHLMLNWPLWGRWKFNFGGFLKCTPNHPVIRPRLRIDETWLVVWNINFSFFPSYWEFHHPNWRTHIFQIVRYTTNQKCFLDPRYSEPRPSSLTSLDMPWQCAALGAEALHTGPTKKKTFPGAPLYDRNKTHYDMIEIIYIYTLYIYTLYIYIIYIYTLYIYTLYIYTLYIYTLYIYKYDIYIYYTYI